MKNIFIIMASFHFSAVAFSQSANSDSVLNAVKNFNYSIFLDKSINDLITVDPVSRYLQYNFLTSQASTLIGIRFKYSDGIYLEIYVNPIKYQNSSNDSGNWDFELMKKEKVFKMRIMVNGRLYRERGKIL